MNSAVQKFQRGDLVRVAKDLGECMSHFTADCNAIVMGSYVDQFGGSGRNGHSYTLFIEGRGEVSWYYEGQLTMIQPRQHELLKTWIDEREQLRKQRADLDWIFANGREVCEKVYGASMQALADCFGCGNLWGSRGEGIDYYRNTAITLKFAAPYLLAGDKAAYLDACKQVRL